MARASFANLGSEFTLCYLKGLHGFVMYFHVLARADAFCILPFVAFGLLYDFEFITFDGCATKALVVRRIGFLNKA